MAAKTPQTKSNHVRFDPFFHFFLIPLSLLIFVWTVVHLVRHGGSASGLLVAISGVQILALTKARLYSLKVQDRVIRLEERLRLAMLAPDDIRSRVSELTESQLIALRFASDAELPTLAQKALNENLTNKQIKDSILTWRPDYWRV
jgi:hypothetical protein